MRKMTLVPKKAKTTGMPSRTKTKNVAMSNEKAVYHSMACSQSSPGGATRCRLGPGLLAQKLDQPKQAAEGNDEVNVENRETGQFEKVVGTFRIVLPGCQRAVPGQQPASYDRHNPAQALGRPIHPRRQQRHYGVIAGVPALAVQPCHAQERKIDEAPLIERGDDAE